ncbi:nucleotide exchange factor GrpE [Candidatus Micrarchaeota archaeon]|nr:nucleotide exchange factor GrpE [Candidatus Micrarchaeota archaeon]
MSEDDDSKKDFEIEGKNGEENYKEKYLRLLAEFDNFKKFKDREYCNVKNIMTKDLIMEIITVWEDLEKAKCNNKEDKAIEMIYNKLSNILSAYGLEQIEVKINDGFDHNIHDAVSHQKSELDEDKIVEIVKNGYMLNGVVIKHPQVVVSKRGEENE